MSREDVEKIEVNASDIPMTISVTSTQGQLMTFNEERNNNMTTTRRTVTVELFDDDKGLPVENALVKDFGEFVTEDDDQTTIQEVLMSEDVEGAIKEHNKARKDIVNEEIRNRTGNEVKLNEVKLKSLRWVVK
jgi:hypothetical protein